MSERRARARTVLGVLSSATASLGKEHSMSNIEIPARGSAAGKSFDERLLAIEPLVKDGWTVEAGLNHIDGICDRAICCGWADEIVDDVMALADTFAAAYAAHHMAVREFAADRAAYEPIAELAQTLAAARAALRSAVVESVQA